MGTGACFPSSISTRRTIGVQRNMDVLSGAPQRITTTATSIMVTVDSGPHVSCLGYLTGIVRCKMLGIKPTVASPI